MSNNMKEKASAIIGNQKKHKTWLYAVAGIAVIVVALTTWVLRSPGHAQEDFSTEGTEGAQEVYNEDAIYDVSQDDTVDSFIKEYIYNEVIITAVYDSSAEIPENAEFRVTKIVDPDVVNSYVEKGQEAIDENSTIQYVYDVGFWIGDEEIEPKSEVQITMKFLNDELEVGDDVSVLHFKNDEEVEVIDAGTVEDDGSVDYELESFSVIVVVTSNKSKDYYEVRKNNNSTPLRVYLKDTNGNPISISDIDTYNYNAQSTSSLEYIVSGSRNNMFIGGNTTVKENGIPVIEGCQFQYARTAYSGSNNVNSVWFDGSWHYKYFENGTFEKNKKREGVISSNEITLYYSRNVSPANLTIHRVVIDKNGNVVKNLDDVVLSYNNACANIKTNNEYFADSSVYKYVNAQLTGAKKEIITSLEAVANNNQIEIKANGNKVSEITITYTEKESYGGSALQFNYKGSNEANGAWNHIDVRYAAAVQNGATSGVKVESINYDSSRNWEPYFVKYYYEGSSVQKSYLNNDSGNSEFGSNNKAGLNINVKYTDSLVIQFDALINGVWYKDVTITKNTRYPKGTYYLKSSQNSDRFEKKEIGLKPTYINVDGRYVAAYDISGYPVFFVSALTCPGLYDWEMLKKEADGSITMNLNSNMTGLDLVLNIDTIIENATNVISGNKTLENANVLNYNGQFEFVKTNASVNGKTWTATGNDEVAVNDATGSFQFPVLNYNEAGTYYYLVYEKQGSVPGISYSTDVYGVKVDVTVSSEMQETTMTTVYSSAQTIYKMKKSGDSYEVDKATDEISFNNVYNIDSKLLIKKFGNDTNGATLDGAEFTITKDGMDPIIVVGNSSEPVSLSNGVYTVTETKSPEGYFVLSKPIVLSVNNGVISVDPSSATPSSMEHGTYQLTSDGVLNVTDEKALANVAFWKNGSGSEIGLSGAKFKVFKSDADKVKGDILMDEIVSGENGIFLLADLAVGEYLIQETVAPDGYNLLSYNIYVTVKVLPESNALDVKVVRDNDGSSLTQYDKNGYQAYGIENTTGKELPHTGGIGTYWFYILGVLIIAGGILFKFKFRKRV